MDLAALLKEEDFKPKFWLLFSNPFLYRLEDAARAEVQRHTALHEQSLGHTQDHTNCVHTIQWLTLSIGRGHQSIYN